MRADCVEDLGSGRLDVFEAFAEEFRIAAIQTDVVLRGTACFEADCAANDKRDRLGFGFADSPQRMILTHPLLWRNVTEHVILLLVGSSHAHWTHHALLRCRISEFFSTLLGVIGLKSHSSPVFSR